MVLFLFFCSGATALIYEVVWSKYLSLLFGSTIQAQTIVLAVFMGGLALGNFLIGSRADRLRQPLFLYGALELTVGLFAFFFDSIYHGGDALFVAVGTPLFGHPSALFVWKLILSAGLLLFPTILMGGTLPLLAAWLQAGSADPGRWSARFYAVNSLGAVCGAWLAGFWLIRALGTDSTLELTAIVNVLVGFTAMALSRRDLRPPQSPANLSQSSAAPPGSAEPARSLAGLSVLVGLTGGISLGLEVLASRSLSLLFGASVQAFAVVLMAFILGIGLGGSLAASPRLKRWRNQTLVFCLLLLAAAFLFVLVLGIEQWVTVYRHLRTGLARTVMGYRFYEIVAAGFSLVLLGVPAGLIGAVLPLCMRWAAQNQQRLARRVGVLLSWNTVGAVLGVLLTGFVLMPIAGLRDAFNLLALVLCLCVVALAARPRRLPYLGAASLVALALVLSSILGGTGWRYVLSSGVFRAHETYVDPEALALRKQHIRLLFYQDAADATVSVEQSDGFQGRSDLSLRISGKPEASSQQDMATQKLLAHLPMLARPGARDVFVLGLASGITAGSILTYPVDHLVVAENCGPVLKAVNWFAPWNRGVVTNPATRVWLEDARTVLKLSPQQYDVIVSEPSNPWFATIGSVFSQEFYQLAAKRLKPGGVMAQWFHLYEMHDGIVDLVLRTFASVFPVLEVWDVGGGDIILLGSTQPWDCSLAGWRKAYEREAVRQDLASIGIGTPEALLAHQLASQRTGFAIPAPGPGQSDTFPLLEYDAPLAFFVGESSTSLARFDERTWQAAFASPEKRAALAGLDVPVLRNSFHSGTINAELWQLLGPRLQPPASSGPAAVQPATAKLPCLLVPALRVAFELPAGASPEYQGLLSARARLLNQEPAWEESVQTILHTLRGHLTAPPSKPWEEPAARFAAAAARTCLVHSSFTTAKELLEIGSKFDPADPELGYLQRILEREIPPPPPSSGTAHESR